MAPFFSFNNHWPYWRFLLPNNKCEKLLCISNQYIVLNFQLEFFMYVLYMGFSLEFNIQRNAKGCILIWNYLLIRYTGLCLNRVLVKLYFAINYFSVDSVSFSSVTRITVSFANVAGYRKVCRLQYMKEWPLHTSLQHTSLNSPQVVTGNTTIHSF